MTKEQLVEALRKNVDENPCQFACEECNEADCFTPVLRTAADLIEQQAAKIAELEAKVSRWIPVTERLPKKQAWYHVAIRDKKTMRVSVEQDLYAVETAKNFGHEIGFCKADRWPEREELIAWMPLPEPPETDGGGEDG
ncbi:MAG: DUF551 domain-containing protein [Candidatus Faecousia sp.]|uniref:DUF551 domain-containing protein n=1 Tax=Faecousia sp. TaxID=2952921 RepID=UPI002A8A9BD5|nr:DUF551 domain-containing protein [Candidatus Faecousia sp.]